MGYKARLVGGLSCDLGSSTPPLGEDPARAGLSGLGAEWEQAAGAAGNARNNFTWERLTWADLDWRVRALPGLTGRPRPPTNGGGEAGGGGRGLAGRVGAGRRVRALRRLAGGRR